MAKNGTLAYVTELPDCDFCKELVEGARTSIVDDTVDIRKAEYDFKTVKGYWANGCSVHWIMWRLYSRLGVGMGQKLEVHTTTGESDPVGQS